MSDVKKTLPTFAALQQRNVEEQLAREEQSQPPKEAAGEAPEALPKASIAEEKPKAPRTKKVQMYKSTFVQTANFPLSGQPPLDARTMAEVRQALRDGWKSNKDVPLDRLVADLPAELHWWTKSHCGAQGLSIKNLVIALLLAYRQSVEEAEQEP